MRLRGAHVHYFLCHVVARNLPAEPRNPDEELLNFLSQNVREERLPNRKANI